MIDQQQPVRQVQEKVPLITINILLAIERFELESEVVAEGAVEAEK